MGPSAVQQQYALALEVLGQDFANVMKEKTTPFQWRGREDEEGAVRR
jgi:hypothetical protein